MKKNIWNLEGKTALITGSTYGIGFSIAKEMASLGAQVFIVSRKAENVNQSVAKLSNLGFRARGFVADVSVYDDRKHLFNEISNHTHSLDILVNNVGTNIRKKTIEYSYEEYIHILNTNMNSNFEITRFAYSFLKKSKAGALVNVLSVAGFTHLRTGSPYGMTKAALNQLTKNLAVDGGFLINGF